MKLILIPTLILLGAMLPAAAAVSESRRASIRGGGGDGKCTIEVDVDGTAEVEIFGDNAILRTIYGAPARFRRFECNQVMPRNPLDFRFRGIDGRGRQDLVRPPSDGRPAVIRIDDPKGGSEGYTFDIEWRGSGGGFGRPPIGGGYGGRRPESAANVSRAIDVCQRAAEERIRRDGYRDIRFERTRIDDNPGRNDWVIGTLFARRRGDSDEFRFSCSVDFREGRVRDVEVRRR